MNSYEDMITEMYESDTLDKWYDVATDAQKAVMDEIIARHELSEEEFEELIDNPIYYKGEEEE